MIIKKILHIKHINYLTLAVLGNQIIIHCEKNQWIRIQSASIINIIGNILLAKEKFLQNKQPFTIHLEIQRSLQNFVLQVESKRKSIWRIFKKDTEKDTKSSVRRTSFCIIQVNQKNFILEIGKKVYKAIFQNAQLLHISGDATGFRFDSENYQYKDINQNDTIYWKQIKPVSNQKQKQKQSSKKFLRRKIYKNSKYQTEEVRRNLLTYKHYDYSQNILFALQVDTHFQIITQMQQNWKYSSQYLDLYVQRQKSLICPQIKRPHNVHHLSQEQLKSIFLKLHDFIQIQSKKGNILSSLSPEYIYLGHLQTRISTVLCKLLSRLNVNYLAPEQLQSLGERLQILNQKQDLDKISKRNTSMAIGMGNYKFDQNFQELQNKNKKSFSTKKQINFFSQQQIYKINLWKVGMLMFQLSYFKLPFFIDYVAYKVSTNQVIKVHFPERDIRSIQLHHFLRSLLTKDSLIRGMKIKGQTKASIINPSITNVFIYFTYDYYLDFTTLMDVKTKTLNVKQKQLQAQLDVNFFFIIKNENILSKQEIDKPKHFLSYFIIQY